MFGFTLPRTPKKKRAVQTHLQRSPSKHGTTISSLVSVGLSNGKTRTIFDPFAATQNKARMAAEVTSDWARQTEQKGRTPEPSAPSALDGRDDVTVSEAIMPEVEVHQESEAGAQESSRKGMVSASYSSI